MIITCASRLGRSLAAGRAPTLTHTSLYSCSANGPNNPLLPSPQVHIAERHLIPRLLAEHGLHREQLVFPAGKAGVVLRLPLEAGLG